MLTLELFFTKKNMVLLSIVYLKKKKQYMRYTEYWKIFK